MRTLSLVAALALALLGLVAVGSAIGDGLPEVGFQTDTTSIVESAEQVNLDITLTISSTQTVTVGFDTREGTALAGQDYVSATGILQFTPGITLQTVSVMVLDDVLPEQDESFSLVLTGAQNAALGLYPTMTVTITDDGSRYVVILPLVMRHWPPLPIENGMVLVPAGEFQMGCDRDHNGGNDCYYHEVPLHKVYLDAYTIDKYEVTNLQYAQCVAARACNPPMLTHSSERAYYYGYPEYSDY
ncbi:MAG: SUMF1/EgtB/PvdO family nonheme iron enzyme, partial [Anaerolineae bacterium]|nr:SUMF1/EgtB/PvdO family nonheme iron enzyme [Anaerolineae bacterium]